MAAGKKYLQLSSLGIFGQLVLLALSMLLVLAIVAPLAFFMHGEIGLSAVGLAALLCFVPSAVTLQISSYIAGPLRILYALAIGMLLRVGLPLAVCLVVIKRELPIASAGFVFYVLAFYLISLAVDTVLLAAGSGAGSASFGAPRTLSMGEAKPHG